MPSSSEDGLGGLIKGWVGGMAGVLVREIMVGEGTSPGAIMGV